jgi:N-ethylmaleimide reductase
MRDYYAQRASAGLIISEGTWVSEHAQGWYGVPGLYTAEQGAAWKKITDAVHAGGGLIFAQLWHQGSVSLPEFYSDGRLPLGPSAVNPMQHVHTKDGVKMSGVPRAMTTDDIRQTIRDFRHSANVAKDAGFDGIQIQGGFVYLFQQFLQESSNLRSDEYGGDFAGRSRILFEALEAVLEVWPSQRVGIKAGPMMNEHGVFKATESALPMSEYIYKRLDTYNLSHILVMRQMANLAGTPLAHMAGDAILYHMRRFYSGTFIANSGIDPEHADRLIRDGAADLIAFARPYIANPDLVERIRTGAPLEVPKKEYFYGQSSAGYTDYTFLTNGA